MEFPSTAADVSGQSMQLGPFLMNVLEIHAGFRMNAIEWQESTVLITGGTVHQSVTRNAENMASVKSKD
jgi:hypothetical protein